MNEKLEFTEKLKAHGVGILAYEDALADMLPEMVWQQSGSKALPKSRTFAVRTKKLRRGGAFGLENTTEAEAGGKGTKRKEPIDGTGSSGDPSNSSDGDDSGASDGVAGEEASAEVAATQGTEKEADTENAKKEADAEDTKKEAAAENAEKEATADDTKKGAAAENAEKEATAEKKAAVEKEATVQKVDGATDTAAPGTVTTPAKQSLTSPAASISPQNSTSNESAGAGTSDAALHTQTGQTWIDDSGVTWYQAVTGGHIYWCSPGQDSTWEQDMPWNHPAKHVTQ
jgi:colicin import membrane protein